MRLALALVALAACGGPAAVPVAGGAGESCSKPLFVTAPLTLDATTEGFADDDGTDLSACGGSGTPDVVFAFTATAGQAVTATVTTSAFQPSLKLRSAARGCVDLDQACSTKPSPVALTAEPITLGGVHYLVVDGLSQQAGPFHLELVLR